jgi:hypothetical protein
VPEFLYPPLQGWLYRALQHDPDGPVMALRGGHGYTADTREIMLRIQTSTQPWLLNADDPKFLDAIDATLRWRFGLYSWEQEDAEILEGMLAAGNSAWRVSQQLPGLERRVDPTITAAVGTTIATAPEEAANHLRDAWTAAYGRHPDPDKAYATAVKAVEAAACPLVLPTTSTATLGRVRDHLRDAPAKWELALPAKDGTPGQVTPVVGMMTSLWEGQRSRHAGTPSSRRQDQAAAG